MRIVFFQNNYNELQMLQFKHKYCIDNGFEMFIADNMSTDGSQIYMQRNNIPYSTVNTNNTWDLLKILDNMTDCVHEVKPDWFIFQGMDAFPVFKSNLEENIITAKRLQRNQISLPQYTICNVGIKNPTHPFKNHFWYKVWGGGTLISEYNESVKIIVDGIYIDDANRYDGSGVVFESHVFNTPARRQELLQRRQRAWDNGLPYNYGGHLREEAVISYITPVSQCLDVRKNIELYEYYKQLEAL